MKQKAELYELIKSLDKNEKRYFKLYASSQKGKKNYLKLFNVIDKQINYNEAEIKKMFAGEKFITQIGFTKNYLYNLIIRSLVSYNNENSVDSRIHTMISQCKILYNKALFSQYFKTLEKVKQICKKYERYGYLLQVLDMEKMIIKKQEVLEDKASETYSEAMDAIENLKLMFEYTRITAKLLDSYRAFGIARSEARKNTIENTLRLEVMNISEDKLCYRARESFYRVHEIIGELNAEYTDSLNAQEKRLKIVNDFPLPFENYIIKFSEDILFTMVDTNLKLNRINEAEKYLRQMTPPGNKSDEVDYDLFIPLTEFRIMMKKGNFKEATKASAKLEDLLLRYKDKMLIDTELGIKFEIVKCLIMANDFESALLKSNELMNHPFLDKREDYESYLRVMNLIIHYELRNYDLLKYLIISTYRFLFKRKKLFRLESLILEFIRKLPGLKENDDLGYLFHSFRKKLEELKEDKYEKNAFEYFDFYNWIVNRYSEK